MDLLLNDVEVPEGITEITESTFKNHRFIASLKIPNTILVIGERAFEDCVNLKSIELPQSILAIGKYAFHNCSALESINIPEEVKTIEEGTFKDCTGLESIVLHENITSIKDDAFANCTGIKNLVLPDNLISCSSTAFPNSRKYLPMNKNYICDDDGMVINTMNSILLFYCGNKKNVKIPTTVKGIGFRAFWGCSLESVRVPEGVTSIGEGAFDECGDEVKVVLPESVDFIENQAFGSCAKILCKKASYAENWCRTNPDCKQLDDEEF